ncbi:hypothetical protein DO021_21570 [Desulfobacter hydrogenophilus]|uniref:Uncharacterized protein n=1 Tax=Desulfobacter hydrogenophilus TaxID=2291 RepID=A0A328FAC7_9BACT|nr:hypothetical protein [Desulfobacter hydrogenophilus]NDY74453.1 hypothetical protein [Desulfobacter hydrogenophilus]QBH14291.1 hypothetical protein EYB58_16035 [Desulfobacter hydrogenophilus]RAL99986.1 hypothetical protein DO021_21570 [Desulfobacter hydrogenophilus]
MDDEVKGKIFRIFENVKKPGPNIKNERPIINASVAGKNNIVSGRDINIAGDLNIKSPPKVNRTQFTPGPQHITAKQAKQLKDVIDNLALKEEAGGMPRNKACKKWWSKLKERYSVASYREIPVHLGDEALSWIKQQSAIKRHKIRRTNNPKWRNELYSAIWAKSKNLNLSKGDVYNIVYTNLDKRVSSLTQLGEQNLKKLHSIIMKLE